MKLTRFFDLLFSVVGLIMLSPVIVVIIILIKLNSRGNVFYPQIRVGRYGKDFKLLKFRTMHANADKIGLLTVGSRDNRITSIGYYLRKYKLDEIPQLINVLKGEMSIVGPRPEVRKYVEKYTVHQRKVLEVLPGITDFASLKFSNENELLAKVANPEEFYIKELIPQKCELNFIYINDQSIKKYFTIIAKTIVTSLIRN